MAHQMVLFPCYGYLMILLVMLIKEEARGKVLLLYTWSHGMLMYLSFLILGKTMERKSTEPGIYFMLFGSLISLWSECKTMVYGHYFALMRLQAWQTVGARNLRNCTHNMKKMARQRRLCRHRTCGLKF
uniref:Uncharacterized protein n=1 Tax=Rhizophora mucronata TaxID=61149 RepID=A0A2P2N2F4_RHIMU